MDSLSPRSPRYPPPGVLALGYWRVSPTDTPERSVADRRVMVDCARRFGWQLDEVFTEADANRPLSAFIELLGAARQRPVALVLVPDASHLGLHAGTQFVMRQRIERESGRQVVFCR